jgi:hypothetical protein
VAAGDTATELPVTVPTPLLMDSVGTGLPLTTQDNWADWPAVTVEGLAEKEVMAGAAAAAWTVTVTWAEAEPLAFWAVKV